MPESVPCELFESRVDYITATSLYHKCSDNSEMEHAALLAESLLCEERDRGNDVRKFRFMNFDGVTSGQASVGISPEGYLFRLSGECAGRNWNRVYDVSTNVSRLDLAATIRLTDQWRDMSYVHHGEALRYQDVHAPHLKVTRIDGGKFGNSLMIGSRASDAYGRIYDKFAESRQDHYLDCWRYEVEFKRSRALSKAAQLSAHDGQPDTAAEIALEWFSRVIERPIQVSIARAMPGRFQAPSDDQRRIQWMTNCCRGSVQKLLANGKCEELLNALGIDRAALESVGYLRLRPWRGGPY
jgi:hypothetical protein